MLIIPKLYQNYCLAKRRFKFSNILIYQKKISCITVKYQKFLMKLINLIYQSY